MPIIGFFMGATLFGLCYVFYCFTLDVIAWIKQKRSKSDRNDFDK